MLIYGFAFVRSISRSISSTRWPIRGCAMTDISPSARDVLAIRGGATGCCAGCGHRSFRIGFVIIVLLIAGGAAGAAIIGI